MKLAKTGIVLVGVFYLLNLSCSHQTNKSSPPNRSLAQDATEAGSPIAPSSPKLSDFDQALQNLGLNIYFGNMHSHHFMSYKPGKKNPDQVEHIGPGECSVKGTMQEDDGKPCRNNPEGLDSFVDISTDRLGYFKMACEYARENGKLDVLFVTPHSKNNGEDTDNRETDTSAESYQKRHALLAGLNAKYNGKFLCGLGQEASSISKGNHINIFGQFKADEKDVKPFFFPPGDFKKFYTEVKARRLQGEKIILQFNHPDTGEDIYTKELTGLVGNKKAKEYLNDYGLDDYAPVGCMIKDVLKQQGKAGEENMPAGCTPEMIAQPVASNELLRETFKNIRAASGNPFRLIEVVSPGGATDNATTEFRKVGYGAGSNSSDEGIRDWIFYLNMGFRLSPTANQDNHHANWGTATSSRTGMLMRALNDREVLNAFDKRRTFASEDVNAKIIMWSEDLTRKKSKSVNVMGAEFVTKALALDVFAGFQDPDVEDREISGKVFYYTEKGNVEASVGRPGAFHFTKFWIDGVGHVPLADPQSLVEEFLIKSGEVAHLKIPLQAGSQYFWVQFEQRDGDRIWSAPIWVNQVTN